MNTLFVTPYIYDFTAYDLWLRPLGLLYLTAIVRKFTDANVYWINTLDRYENHNSEKSLEDGRGKFHRELVTKPDIYNTVPRHYSRYGMPFELFCERIENLPDIDIIFMTTMMTYWIEGVDFTISALKKRFPRAKIVVGGLLPSLINEYILKKYLKADFFVPGPGENKILEIISENNGKVYKHPDFSDINNIPYPAYEYLGNKKFLPLLTSRGCPYKCTYCASHILNPIFRERTYENTLKEIYYCYQRYQPQHLIIFDDALLINKKKRLFRILVEAQKNIEIKFHTPNGLHASEIDIQTAQLLFESNFKTIRLGFESINSKTLARSSHKINIKQMIKAVDNLETAGFRRNEIEVYLLFGAPGQTPKEIEKSLLFVKFLGVIPRLAYYSPVPNTKDFSNLQKKGILNKEINPYETNKIYFVYQKSGFSLANIDDIKNLTREITLTSKQTERQLN